MKNINILSEWANSAEPGLIAHKGNSVISLHNLPFYSSF